MQIIGDKAVSSALNSLANQGPFVVSSALNTTAFAAQKEVRNKLPQWIHLTRNFIPQSVVVEKASKSNLSAVIGFLKRVPLAMLFETGGNRQAVNGKSLAIPVEARRNAKGGISNANRPRQLMGRKGIFIERLNDITGLWKTVKSLPLSLLYIFKRTARYHKQFHFHDTVRAVVSSDMEKNIRAAMEYAIRTVKRG